MTSCDECTPGTFSSNAHSVSCEDCPRGYYQHASKRGSCLPCVPGLYSDDFKMKKCKSCSPGRYTTQIAANGTCVSCSPGYYQQYVGSVSCLACIPGRYVSYSEASSCGFCPQGFFSNVTSSLQCHGCDVGMTTSGLKGRDGCVDCPAGYRGDDDSEEPGQCQVRGETGVGGSIFAAAAAAPPPFFCFAFYFWPKIFEKADLVLFFLFFFSSSTLTFCCIIHNNRVAWSENIELLLIHRMLVVLVPAGTTKLIRALDHAICVIQVSTKKISHKQDATSVKNVHSHVLPDKHHAFHVLLGTTMLVPVSPPASDARLADLVLRMELSARIVQWGVTSRMS